MLESYREAHEKCASIIDGWKDMNKNDLINKYIEVENDKKLADAYMSAIICRYWSKISTYEMKSFKSVNDQTIYYDWLVSAILRAIKRRKWKDPNNKLYNDPNGPDKVVNRVIKCERLGWYQHSNKNCRKLNYGIDSLEFISEDRNDCDNVSDIVDSKDFINNGVINIRSLVDGFIKKGEYVSAFVVNGIVNYNMFDRVKGENGKKFIFLNKKKLNRYINTLKYDDCSTFSYFFDKPIETVIEMKNKCKELSRNKIRKAIDRSLKDIRKAYLED